MFTNSEMFFPCTGKPYDDMVESGYKAFMEWAKEGGKMNRKVGSRIPNYPALYVLWFLKFFEVLYYLVIHIIDCIVSLLLKGSSFFQTKFYIGSSFFQTKSPSS